MASKSKPYRTTTKRARAAPRAAKVIGNLVEHLRSLDESSSVARPKELLLSREVQERTRLSNTTIWRLEKANRFPKRMIIGFKRVAWRTVEIDAFIAGTWSAPQQAKAA